MNFTVLMSLYIKEDPNYLDECLNSLQLQTRLADEIIIVLDGPISKELEDVLIKWNHLLPIKSIPLNQNIGLGRALNRGLDYCSNDWIFRMDTDDICVPNRFEEQIKYIEKHPDIVLLGGQIKEFTNNTHDANLIRAVPTNAPDIYSYAIKRNPFNHMTVAYRKSIIKQLGGYKHHLFMEDYNLWLRVIANHKNIHNLPDVLVIVRAGDAMLSRRKGSKYIKSEWQLFKLKNSLGYHSFINGLTLFFARSIPRLLPKRILSKIYRAQRKQL